MDVIEAIKTRKSIRGYKPEPVPKALLREVLEVAMRSPSSMNTQPWEFTVVSGQVLDAIRQEILHSYETQPPAGGGVNRTLTGKYRERQIGLAVQIFKLLGIAREDTQKRAEWMKKGIRFFDAPAVIFISVEESLGQSAVFDSGLMAQTIALAAVDRGLGTCIHDRGLRYLDIVKKHTGMAESRRIVTCMSIGYPDWDFPANKIQTVREPVDSVVTWCGI